MKILFFTRLFYPHIGGVEKHVLEISKILIKKGYKVTVITEKHDKNLLEKEKVEEILVYRISVGKSERLKKFQIWWWLLNHKKLIKNADIIHCHDVFFWYLPFRMMFLQKPVYTTFHGYESYPISKKAIIVRKISEILSWGNICIGDYIKKWYGTKPNYVTYGGVNIIKSSKLKVQNYKSAVFIGRLDEQTGILDYVEAVKLIRKKIPDFEFVVIGDGKYRKKIEKYATVLGFKKNPEKYFSKYHFAFVSRYLSILEAMTSQRLVFALYDNPIKEDYLKMSPFVNYIIVIGSAKDLASKILYFINNKDEEKEIIDKAYIWVKNQSWDKVVEVHLKFWRRLLSHGSNIIKPSID